jgi:DNA-binding protein H-NS
VANYRELLKQHEALQIQIDAAREQEVAAAIERVREIIGEYSLTPEQVFAQPKGKRGPKPATKPAKYRDPASGATWSGMGREPLWIKGQSREQFLIQP